MNDMCEITDKIESLVKDDKNGKVLILITKLIDERFNTLSKDQNSMSTTLNEINEKISCVNKNCDDIKKLNDEMEILSSFSYFSKHPKIAIALLVVVVLGVLMAYMSGIDNLMMILK